MNILIVRFGGFMEQLNLLPELCVSPYFYWFTAIGGSARVGHHGWSAYILERLHLLMPACYTEHQPLPAFPEESPMMHSTYPSTSRSPSRRQSRAVALGLISVGSLIVSVAQSTEPAFMSGEWGPAACAAWNEDPILTKKLVDSGWIKNDKGRGYKVLQVYRSDCGDKPTVELRVALKDGKAQCVYGGPVQTQQLDHGADYVMHATTARWKEMGAGDYGPMKAMMFGRLSFSGPYGEAMGNMGPFGNFLLLAGKVQGAATCP